MSLNSLIKAQQVFTTTDGKQHSDIAAAEAHQVMLNNAAGIEKVANSFANVISAPGSKEVGLVGRTRVFNVNVASQFLSFLIAQGVIEGDVLEAFEAIEPSEELQARIDADAKAAEEKAAAAKAKKEAGKPEVEATEEAPVDEDLFK
ncbi:hypothetical protein QNH08_gp37 [Aeromonas phage pAh6.2TG]|uniref:Uncharacterized protein n=2 Tax=Phayathaivirus TaxID=3153015 RepID=A0A8F3C957_9CAUD|nr:hypothetical protein QNH08_gp37 [Aeromonas phage pAh6.2TG]YP_010845316.1 hypothetical protein QNH09_gp34 [Aeromonas phage PVN03]QLI47634.1 hypothetical protein [Aeromonas phage PVN02]QTQ06880.1 hypothetical protein [Aeromonas phage PVN04]QTQ06947.1 hypothetical protein [Aeromonas phage PVN05]QTQ06816.1 hypothetical protein [Aeromonas phage PVN03]QWY14069.1 hypothetical protein [Aeromonas phage pAh6.2TG]